HKRELTGPNRHWSYLENGCSKMIQNKSGETQILRQPGYIIRGVLDIRLYFILPEYVFIMYCFDEDEKLTSVNINVEVDGI
ncbi:MAG: hypothetical protein ACSHWU_11710, partial [Marinicella sp.]